MNKFLFALASLLLIAGDAPRTKIDSIEQVVEILEKHTSEYASEKVYLHMSQPYFAIGDKIWFKAYLVAGPHHIPSPLSKIIYTELIGPDGSIVEKIQLPVNQGVSKGDFELSNNLPSGNYTLRAYTNWMKNFDKRYFFSKNFQVVNAQTDSESIPKDDNMDRKFDLRFFPEGGDLVEELPSLVAFEGSSDKTVSGTVYNSQDEPITTFELNNTRRGTFEITPAVGQSYYVKLEDIDEVFALPPAQKSGFTMHVDNASSDQHVQVQISSKNPNDERLKVYLLVQTRGMMTYATEIGLAADLAKFNIPRRFLKNGISQITLFDSQFRPQSERLIYHFGQESITSDISTDKDRYIPREQTKVKIQVKDKDGNPVEGNFSLAAFDAAQINPSHIQENILSSLLIDADIIGNLENSIQYINGKTNAQALDLHLMTEGWRRFKWKDLLENGIQKPSFIAEQGFEISGTVKRNNGKPVNGGSIKHIGQFAGLSTFTEGEIDAEGKFRLKDLRYFESNSFIEAVDKRGRKELQIEFDTVISDGSSDLQSTTDATENDQEIASSFYEQSRERELNDAAYDNSNIEAFLQRNKERLSIDSAYNFGNVTDLGTVTIQNNQNNKISSNAPRGLVFNRGEYSLNASDMMADGQTFRNALFLLQGRIPGFTITMDAISSEPNVQMTRKVWSIVNPDPPILYIIDDTPVGLAAVTGLMAERVERIEVLKGMRATGIYGTAGNGGAIVIYTKTGTDQTNFNKRLAENAASKITNTKRLKNGFYQAREFYRPDYGRDLPEHIKPDRRALIHWEPMIRTNGDGVAEIEFYNADLETTIQIDLQGLSDKGELLSTRWSYEVSRLKQ